MSDNSLDKELDQEQDNERDNELGQSCRSLREDFSAYLDGELPANQEGEVRAHLSDCEACASFLTQLRGVDDLLHGLQRPTVPGSMLSSVQAQVEQVERDGSSSEQSTVARPSFRNESWTWVAPLAAAAAVLVLLGGARLFGVPFSDGSQRGEGSTLIAGVEEEDLLFSIDLETIEELEILEELDVLEAMARERNPDLFSNKATRS
jgi:hypothetical protein